MSKIPKPSNKSSFWAKCARTGRTIFTLSDSSVELGISTFSFYANFKRSSRPNSSMPLFFNKLSFRVAEDFSVTFFDVVVLVEVFLLVANFKKLFESSY